MSFRSDLDAAHARISSLEGELQKARDEIDRLKQAAAEEPDEPAPEAEKPKRTLGRVSFRPPRVVFPLVHLYLRALVVALEKRPRLNKPTSNSLLAWVLWAVVLVPLVYALWLPAYLVLLVVFVAPWAGAITLALTAVITPIVLLSRIRIEGGGRDPVDTGWLHGEFNDDTAAIYLWVMLAITMPPLLPIYLPLLPD